MSQYSRRGYSPMHGKFQISPTDLFPKGGAAEVP